MAHYQENPRTNKYSKVKLILIRIELLLKKGFLFLFVLINFVLHTKKSKYIDLGDYTGKDSRFINYLFESLKSKYNFSYDVSFTTLDFIKKIGIRNFIFHATPNLFIKKKNKLKFNLNISKKGELNFNTNYFYKFKENKLFLPYYMYPRIYNSSYDELKKYKNNFKQIRIFFSGSTNEEVYGKFTWFNDDKTKLLNRVEIINFIIKNFKDKIFFLKSYKDLDKINHLEKPIVLSINDGLIKKTKTNLTNIQHLELISKSNFILTAPGGDMPLCHHLIEGIKMRAIPISNYANLHKPALSDQDYLYFKDYETLNESILNALRMRDYEIKIKQKRLEKFYEEKLSPQSFLTAFENRKDDEIISCNDVESLRWLQ